MRAYPKTFDNGTEREAGVETCFRQRHREHARGRCLAVGSSDRDEGAISRGEHEPLGAVDDRDSRRSGRGEFDVGVADCGGDDDEVGPLDVCRVVSDVDGGAAVAEVVECVGVGLIRALNGVPGVDEEFGYGAHA